ncbi:MAG TPA: multicopper oxidase family protein [Jiangellales bacterium]|nr:multicopper oxidase family protein [Jiangellales bacterium]
MLTRRTLLGAGLAAAGAGLLAACGNDPRPQMVSPDGEEVRDAEARRNPGPIHEVRLKPTVGPVDLGGLILTTWTYGGVLPGAPIRVTAGQTLRATVSNGLPEPTTVHWHGLALRNDADGVPGLTQDAITAGADYTYEFAVPHPGTYWLHPHVGTQLDRGLYAPLIVDDPREPLAYDDEWIVVLDDWLDGLGRSPDQVLADLRAGGMGHMMTGASSYLLGGDAGDVTYPHFLLNGRIATAPMTFAARPGSRVRIRLVNAGSDTAFRVALGGHTMTVTHTDGFPVQPADTDALLLGMGERYDVLVTLGDGVFPLVALAEGKNATAVGLVRTAAGSPPASDARPRELDGRIVAYRQLTPTDAARLAEAPVDRTIRLELTGTMMAYNWGFNGRAHDPTHFEPVRDGERVQLDLVNTTMMWHPVHLHGHTFAVDDTGVRKDTAIVLPGQTLRTRFDADNPGRWALHCHNIYHAETGMMTQLGYQR